MTHFSSFLKRAGSLAILTIFAAAMTSPAFASAADDDTIGPRLQQASLALSAGSLSPVQSGALKNTLKDALHSDHYGFQTSALRLIIAYGDEIDVGRETVIDVVRLYRDHDNIQVRRMAVVALGTLNDAWANDFLARSEAYENTPQVLQTMRAVRTLQS